MTDTVYISIGVLWAALTVIYWVPLVRQDYAKSVRGRMDRTDARFFTFVGLSISLGAGMIWPISFPIVCIWFVLTRLVLKEPKP